MKVLEKNLLSTTLKHQDLLGHQSGMLYALNLFVHKLPKPKILLQTANSYDNNELVLFFIGSNFNASYHKKDKFMIVHNHITDICDIYTGINMSGQFLRKLNSLKIVKES